MTGVETEMELPHSFDEFTPEWFSKALSERFPGVQVSGFRRSGERVGTSASARFELDYASKGAGEPPPSVYIKGGFTEAQLKRYWVVLQREALFYAEFAERVPMNIPRCLFSATDERRQGLTMLEDLALRPVEFGDWGRLSVDQVADLLEQLATMHGAFWLDEEMKAFTVGWERPERDFSGYMIRDKHWDHLVTRVYGEQLIEAVGSAELAREALARMWALNDAAPFTLLHGDTHGYNTFFETDGRGGFADFQLSFCGTPLYDMSWLIMSGLSIEDRRAEERNLIKTYLKAGTAAGMELPDFDAAWLVHRQQAVRAVLDGACNPIEAGTLEMINRAGIVTCAAAIDLDPLEALGVSRG